MKSEHRARILDSLKKGAPKKEEMHPFKPDDPAHGLDRQPTILIVDDDQGIIDTHTIFLAECGFRTISANSVKAAVSHLQSSPDVSLILLDLAMPEQSGFALLEFIGSNLRFSGIPVVVSTALKNENTVMKARMLGACDYIAKPYTAEVGLARILKALDEAQRRILLVSDDELTLTLIGRTASRSGHRVITTHSGEQAIATIMSRKVDAMIAELVLEDMTGFDLLVRTSEIVRWMPTLFICDPLVRIAEKDVIAAGGYGLIERPFSNLDVSRRVNQMVRCNNMLVAKHPTMVLVEK